ncbi:extracellular solute-binding protein [Paraliomyxa miuraensis]|uniref:extracellular solute-binding protein n=1 Tax=Paraliomyxa miuraensis TaxID=376150 RepID=UPI0022570EAD|nr:extracellular solute-binding protein [Paraliomyxa miuraensis]MCX4246523.1 extracellular solute-binding protein [Paraliomyxa miuraensis]
MPVSLARLTYVLVLPVWWLLGSAAWAAEPIRLWHAYRGAEEEALTEVLAGFEDAPVETLAIPYDAFGSKLAAAIPLGEGPHLYIDSHERLGDYRRRKIVAPAGDALELGVFDPVAVQAVALDGEAWGVPLSRKSVALYVNTALVDEVPATLEGIAALQPSLPPGVYAYAYEVKKAYSHAPLLHAFGGRMLADDDSFGFVGSEAEASLRFAVGLVEQGAVPANADGGLVTNLFKSGKAAFAASGPWLAADLAADLASDGASDVPYRVQSLPVLDATGQPLRPFLTVEAVMLSPHGAQRPEVRALARHLASATAAEVRQRRARTVTARTDVPAPADDPLLAAFAEQAKVAIPMPSSPAMRATWEPADRAIGKVLRGQAEPADALEEAQHRFDDVRRPPPPPASPWPIVVLLSALSLWGAFVLVQRARQPELRERLRRSLPAYRYVAHAVLAVGMLVILPLVVGAATSLFAGPAGEVQYVGLANFIEILTARGGPLLATGSFYTVLLVTLLWTLVNVAFHLGIGLALGLLLSRPLLRLRAVYRVLLIIPWAVPSYVTALAWKGMFDQQYGAITGIILALNDALGLSMEPIAWFSSFSTAFTANAATNIWLGFPFMMVVTIGALTAVPKDVLEAAEVDGATRWQRLTKVVLPMIKPTMMPSITLGAIWTFNMFNVVFLVSGGDPDGSTDILVSEAYRWAFTREAQYGYAAAYAVLIFLMLMITTRLLERSRGRWDRGGRGGGSDD